MSVPQLGEKGRTCSACRFFAASAGECRFTAPTMMGWPSTKAGVWCGEFTAPRTQAQAGEPIVGREPMRRSA